MTSDYEGKKTKIVPSYEFDTFQQISDFTVSHSNSNQS